MKFSLRARWNLTVLALGLVSVIAVEQGRESYRATSLALVSLHGDAMERQAVPLASPAMQQSHSPMAHCTLITALTQAFSTT